MAYVYRHIRADKNEPFYIGIGSDKGYRAKDKKKRNKIWKGIVERTGYKVQILFDEISWEEACQKEIELIELYGRICTGSGTLANLSLGGEGYLDPPSEVRDQLSKSKLGSKNPMYGKLFTESHRNKLKEARKHRVFSKETRDKISEAQKGKARNTEEFKQYLSEINSGNKHPQYGKQRSEDTKAKIALGHLGKKLSADTLQKMALAKSKAVINTLDNKKFTSVKEAALFYNIPRATLHKWVHKEKNNFKFILI
jgi:hypothetical protein